MTFRFMTILCSLILVACETLTEEERFDRYYNEQERVIQAGKDMRECEAGGGLVRISRNDIRSARPQSRKLGPHDTWRCEY